LLSELAVLVSIEIEVSVFLEAFFRLATNGLERHIKEDVNLRRDFSVIRDDFDFIDFYWTVKLKRNLLRVCAETFGLPASVLASEE
jgi:hypothetical protein